MASSRDKDEPGLINPLFKAALLCLMGLGADVGDGISIEDTIKPPAESIQVEWQDSHTTGHHWR